MKKATFIVTLFTLLAFSGLKAQKSIGIMKAQGAPLYGFSQKTADSLFRAAEKAFFAYQSACSLRDSKTGNVTSASIEKFLNLFEFNANIVEDFLFVEPQPEIKSPDYATYVYKYLPQGLDVRFVSAEFTNINYDSLGFYRVFARMVKVVKNGLTKDLKPVVKSDSCVVTQFFTFYVEKKEMDKAKIFRIYPQQGMKMVCYPHGDKRMPFSFYGTINGGVGFTKSNMSTTWPSGTTAQIQLQSDRVTIKGISGGLQYRLKNIPLDIHLGGQYQWFTTGVGLDTFMYKIHDVPDPLDPEKTKFVRGISLINLAETGRISVLQAKIGVTYWMMEKERFNLGFDFLLMPGKVMRYKNNLSTAIKYYSQSTYPNPNSGNEFQVVISENLPNNVYITGDYTYNKDSLAYGTSVFLGAQIAPVFEIKFTDHIALRLGGYFHVSLTDWFKKSTEPNVTPFGMGPTDIQYTLLSEYVDHYKISHFGLQAGLRYKF